MIFAILSVIIALLTLVILMVLHEFGHFIIAKKFGVRVEEFGIGYPPRLFGKKMGDTLYSVNLLPLGAFVRISDGEESEDYHNFTNKPIWQRALIILGGVAAFWIIAIFLLTIVFGLGMPTPVNDEANHILINPKIQITEIASGSPAANAALEPLDVIQELRFNGETVKPKRAGEVISFINAHKGEAITIIIQRWQKTFAVTVTPRVSSPEGEGALGIGLVRTVLKPYPWYEAPLLGVISTYDLTVSTVSGFLNMASSVSRQKGMPSGATFMGPLGILNFLKQSLQLGVNYFLYFVAVISIFLAVFNLVPLPALDGGKLLFLGIEKARGKPVSPKIEGGITMVFFALLITLSIFVTIKFDIPRIF